MERRDLERENKPTLALSEIRNLLKSINVYQGRFVFQKLKELSDTFPLEAAAVAEMTSYQNATTQLLSELFKQQLSINEFLGQIVVDLSNPKKREGDDNTTSLMLRHKRKILDRAYEINELITPKHKLVAHLIEMNKKWCCFEKEYNEKLNVHLMKSEEILDSTNFKLQKKKETKKMQKIRQIKKVAEISWAIMSVHAIDYRKDTKMREIFFRINKAKNLSLQNSRK